MKAKTFGFAFAVGIIDKRTLKPLDDPKYGYWEGFQNHEHNRRIISKNLEMQKCTDT